MIAVSVWDLVSPASRRCDPEHCELPGQTILTPLIGTQP